MRLTPIIEAIRERCPSFECRVGGAAEFARLAETASMDCPCAFVIPLDETAEEPSGHTGYRQGVRAQFGIVLVVSNDQDERGQGGYDAIDDLKDEVFKAVLCWAPSEKVGEIEYAGSSIIEMDRSRLFYQIEMVYEYQLTTEDTYQPIERANLGVLDTVAVDVVATEGKPGETKAKAIFHPLYNNRS